MLFPFYFVVFALFFKVIWTNKVDFLILFSVEFINPVDEFQLDSLRWILWNQNVNFWEDLFIPN